MFSAIRKSARSTTSSAKRDSRAVVGCRGEGACPEVSDMSSVATRMRSSRIFSGEEERVDLRLTRTCLKKSSVVQVEEVRGGAAVCLRALCLAGCRECRAGWEGWEGWEAGQGAGGGGGGGMSGMPGGMGAPQKKKQHMHDLQCTLAELFHGATKKLKITRQSVSAGRSKEHTFEIAIKKGWKAGTKLTYEGEGDEAQAGQAQDVVFVIKEKPHAHFKRSGSDLIYAVRDVALVDALTGFQVPPRALEATRAHLLRPRPAPAFV